MPRVGETSVTFGASRSSTVTDAVARASPAAAVALLRGLSENMTAAGPRADHRYERLASPPSSSATTVRLVVRPVTIAGAAAAARTTAGLARVLATQLGSADVRQAFACKRN